MAASTREVDIVLRGHDQTGPACESAAAGMKGFAHNAQRAGAGMSQLGALVGSASPAFAQLGGLISQTTNIVSDLVMQMGKAGAATSLISVAPFAAAAAAGLILVGVLDAMAAGAKRFKEEMKQTQDHHARWQAAMKGADKPTTEKGQEAENAQKEDLRRWEELKARRKELGKEHWWSNAEKKEELERINQERDLLRGRQAVTAHIIKTERARRTGEDKEAGMKGYYDGLMEQERTAMEEDRQLQEKAAADDAKLRDGEYQAAMDAANRLNDFEQRQTAEQQAQADKDYEESMAAANRNNAYDLQHGGGETRRPSAIEGRFLTRVPSEDPGLKVQNEHLVVAKAAVAKADESNELLRQLIAARAGGLAGADLN